MCPLTNRINALEAEQRFYSYSRIRALVSFLVNG